MPTRVAIRCEDLFGLEIYSILNEANAYAARSASPCETYDVVAFLSDVDAPFGTSGVSLPVVRPGAWRELGNVKIVMGISDPAHKEAAAKDLDAAPDDYLTFVSPWTVAPERSSLGHGCFIAAHNFKDDCEFGRFVTLLGVMSETSIIGDYTTVSWFTNVTNATVGKGVSIGAHAFLMEHINVGDGAIIYPGSIVFGSVRPGARVAGIPANRAKYTAIEKSLTQWRSGLSQDLEC